MAESEMAHVRRVSALVRAGIVDVSTTNAQLVADQRPYSLSVGNDGTVSGAVGTTRDYFLPPRHARHVYTFGLGALIAFMQALLAGYALIRLSRTEPV